MGNISFFFVSLEKMMMYCTPPTLHSSILCIQKIFLNDYSVTHKCGTLEFVNDLRSKNSLLHDLLKNIKVVVIIIKQCYRCVKM